MPDHGLGQCCLGEQHCWRARRTGLPWPGCSLWVDRLQASASHCPCLAPHPPQAGRARPLSQGPLFIKSLRCSHPKPKEQCQPQIRLGLGSGPRGTGVGHPATQQLPMQFWEGYRPAGLPALGGEALGCPRSGPSC